MGAIVLLWMYRGVYDKFLLYWNGMGLRDFIIKDMGAGVYMGGRKGAGGGEGYDIRENCTVQGDGEPNMSRMYIHQ